MIYDWIKNRNRFRVEVSDAPAGAALLQIVRRWGAALDEEETFIRDVDADNRSLAVVYITPFNGREKHNVEQALDLIDIITD
jgi:hypothetical protein